MIKISYKNNNKFYSKLISLKKFNYPKELQHNKMCNQ